MNNTNMVFVFAKKCFPFMIYVADMAILMSNFDNFDHDQISLKFAKKFILGSLDNAENTK